MALCIFGLVLLVGALALELCAWLLPWGTTSPGIRSPLPLALPIALQGLLLLTLFGIGPAGGAGLRPSLSKQFFDKPSWNRGWVETLAYSVTAIFFFVLFCLAAYMSSETRTLGEHMAVVDWPLWLVQSALVVAFGCNVVRFSIYAADASARPIARSSVERLHQSASSIGPATRPES